MKSEICLPLYSRNKGTESWTGASLRCAFLCILFAVRMNHRFLMDWLSDPTSLSSLQLFPVSVAGRRRGLENQTDLLGLATQRGRTHHHHHHHHHLLPGCVFFKVSVCHNMSRMRHMQTFVYGTRCQALRSAAHKLFDAAATSRTSVNIHWRIAHPPPPPTAVKGGLMSPVLKEKTKKRRSLSLTSVAVTINKAIPLN